MMCTKHFLTVALGLLLLSIPLSSPGQHADIRVLRDLHVKRNQNLDLTFSIISESAIPTALAIPSSFLVTGLVKKDTLVLRQGLAMVGALALNTGITYGLKYAIQRQRPYVSFNEIDPVLKSDSPAFPSGHTSVAFATATNLTLAIPKWYVAVPAFTWASAVGYSRMHLGVHYPSDVLVGALVGMGSSWISFRVNRWLQSR